MTLPNIISFSRIPLLFCIVMLFQFNHPWVATSNVALFIFGSLTDLLDGFIARRFNKVSDFGKILDALTDKIFTIGLCITLLASGILPFWMIYLVLLTFTREFLITGLRLIAVNKGVLLAAERSGKIKTVLQMVSIGFLLEFHALTLFKISVPLVVDIFYWVGILLFILSALMTIWSGYVYLSKYGYMLKEEAL